MDQTKSVTSGRIAAPWRHWPWDRPHGWRGLALLIADLVLPFGWIVPTATPARVRVASRRR